MEIFDSTESFSRIQNGLVLSIGNFDGLHLGHQEIIEAAKAAAKKSRTGLVVMTFDPHPAVVLHPEKTQEVLTPLELKKHLLEKHGVEQLIVLRDSFELLNLSPESFVDEFLMRTIQPAVVVEGINFNFGYGRSGNIDTLRQLGAEKGFEVIVVEPKKITLSDGKSVTISSSLIRNILETGRVEDASVALGRPFRLIGRVIKGRGKGRQLGFPTANLSSINQLIPAEGVYTGFVEIEDTLEDICRANKKLKAVFSIGRAKTFVTEQPLLVEAHVIDARLGNIFGKYLAMDFIKHLRHQQRFDSETELSEQITKDCKNAKKIFAIRP